MRIFKNKIAKKLSLESLWLDFLKGDDSAIDSIYRQLYQDLYSYGQRFRIDTSVVEDSIHTLFLNLFKYRKTLKEVKNVKSYLFRSFRNILIRKDCFKDEFMMIDDIERIEETETIYDESQILKVKKLIKELSPREKEIILLKYYENYSNTEISEILDIEYTTVRNLINRALNKLRKVGKEGINIFFMLFHI
jgi:RNA polymerase sigma factor (sigma-70 family)